MLPPIPSFYDDLLKKLSEASLRLCFKKSKYFGADQPLPVSVILKLTVEL